MATKPTNLAEWATGAAPIVEPTLPQKQAGWPVDFKPPAQWFNWWWNLIHLWIVWLDAFESEGHTWTGIQVFNNATQFNSSINVVGTSSLATVSIGPSGIFQLLKKAGFDIANAETPLLDRVQVASTPHLLFEQLVTASVKLRVYVTVDLGLMVTYNARWSVAGSNWVRDLVSPSWRVTMGKSFRIFQERSGGASFLETAWITNFSTFDPFGSGADGLQPGTVWFGNSLAGEVVAGRYVPQIAWTNLTLSSNLTAIVGNEPQYYRDTTGRVWMRGGATANTTIVSGSQVATLPVSFPIERLQANVLAIVDSAVKYQLVFQPSGRIDMECGTPGNVLTGTLFNFANLSYRSG